MAAAIRYRLSPLSIRETATTYSAPVASATVTVYLAGTVTAATCYADTTTATALANSQTTTNSSGYFEFYIDSANYANTQKFKIVISKTGYPDVTYDYLNIFPNLAGVRDPWVDVRAYIDLPTAITAIGATSTTLLISTSQTLTNNLTVPPNVTLSFIQGATITIPTTKTLYIKGTVDAGNYVIFSGAGTVNMNEGDRLYNLAWFEGASLDLKWDFARRGLINTVPYTAIIPHQREDDPAAIETVAGKWRWDLAAPLQFDDPENFGEWYIYGQIWASASMESMMKFSPTNKTEDIRFQTRVDIYGNDVATTGVKIVNGAARVFFNDELHIHNVVTCVEGGTGVAIGFVEINKLYAAFFSNAIIDINTTTSAVTGFKVNSIYAEEATDAAAVGVRLSGDIRGTEIGHINYYKGVGAINLEIGVEIEATTGGRAQNGVKIR